MTKYKGSTPSTTARKTRQFNLSDTELDSIYELADLPKQVSKGEALRTVLRNYKDQITENASLKQILKQLTAQYKPVESNLAQDEQTLYKRFNNLDK